MPIQRPQKCLRSHGCALLMGSWHCLIPARIPSCTACSRHLVCRLQYVSRARLVFTLRAAKTDKGSKWTAGGPKPVPLGLSVPSVCPVPKISAAAPASWSQKATSAFVPNLNSWSFGMIPTCRVRNLLANRMACHTASEPILSLLLPVIASRVPDFVSVPYG